MPPKTGIVPVVWRGSGPTRYGGGDRFWKETREYSAAEAHYFAKTLNKEPSGTRGLERTQVAAAGWPRYFMPGL